VQTVEVDAYAVNFDPRLMASPMRYDPWRSTFGGSIRRGVGLDLFGGNIIRKGLGALRAGWLYLRGDYLELPVGLSDL